MKRIVATCVLGAVLAIVALSGGTQAQGPPASIGSKSVRTTPAGSFIEDEVLIQFRAGASEADKAEARGWINGRRQELLRRDDQGELEVAALPFGIPLENAVALLSRHPAVRVAEPNWVYTHAATSNDPYYVAGSLWGMYGATTSPSNQYGSQAGAAWAAGYTGSSSVLVGVIDEGIDFNHPDLAANIWTSSVDPLDGVDNDGNGYIDDIHGWDFYQNNNTIFDGAGDDHGTHVAGTIGGIGGNGVGVAGVNWNVGIISAKFLGPSGGSSSNAIKALDYIVDLKIRHGLNIVATNNSWGGGGYSQSLHSAIIRAANAGILFVAAAGNSGTNNDSTAFYPANYNTSVGTILIGPASYDAVISVAAITSSGAKSSFSNYGVTTVDLGAPGSGVVSTTPNGTYSSYSGTSMATPHVTGAAALYASMNPGASAASIKNSILASAQNTPTASLSGLTVTGGRLNVAWWIGGAPAPPAAPSLLGATPVSSGQINLSWTDNSNDEDGFTIERCQTAGCTGFVEIASLEAGAMFFADAGLAAGTTYRYRVRAFRAGLYSAYAGPAQATTLSASGMTLSASGFKLKGVQHANLSWSPSGGGGNVDVYRNNVKIVTTANNGAHIDNIGAKGGGSYVYKVCTQGTSTCSNDASVIF